jgi:hypothetical protein
MCIGRLVEALDADEGSDFAYAMLGMFEGERPVGLRSSVPWQPQRLRTGNPIDAMALLRAATVRELGGYCTDRRLHGWEDYDLWCRLAEHGRRGTFVAQVLARYRSSQHSMLTVTDLSWRVAVSLLIERYPSVMAGVRPPL